MTASPSCSASHTCGASTGHATAAPTSPRRRLVGGLILAGRGWGKTRTGAEWIKQQALALPGSRWAVVAPTYADARDTCIEGESGLLAVLPDDRIDMEPVAR